MLWWYLRRLRSENPVARDNAARRLFQFKDSRAVEPLINALADVESSVRFLAARALGNIGDARAVDSLTSALVDEDHKVRRSAAKALGAIGDARSVDALVKALEDKDAGSSVIEFWMSGSLCVRATAAEALGKIGDRRALEPLASALKNYDFGTRACAAEALGQLKDPRAIDPLASTLKASQTWVGTEKHLQQEEVRKERYVRLKIVEALGKLEDASAVGPVMSALADNSEEIRQAAAASLEMIRNGREQKLPAPDDSLGIVDFVLLRERSGEAARGHNLSDVCRGILASNSSRLLEALRMVDAFIESHEAEQEWQESLGQEPAIQDPAGLKEMYVKIVILSEMVRSDLSLPEALLLAAASGVEFQEMAEVMNNLKAVTNELQSVSGKRAGSGRDASSLSKAIAEVENIYEHIKRLWTVAGFGQRYSYLIGNHPEYSVSNISDFKIQAMPEPETGSLCRVTFRYKHTLLGQNDYYNVSASLMAGNIVLMEETAVTSEGAFIEVYSSSPSPAEMILRWDYSIFELSGPYSSSVSSELSETDETVIITLSGVEKLPVSAFITRDRVAGAVKAVKAEGRADVRFGAEE